MSQKKVLIIDYDAESLKSLSEFAQDEGCDVVTASDGITGLEKFKAEKPDLVIMEAMLPKLHGFELCKKIAYDSARKVPVIIVTGIYRESVYKSEAIRFYGASAFFEKPWKKEDLQPVFQDLLQGVKPPAEEAGPPEPPPPEPAHPKEKLADLGDEWGLLLSADKEGKDKAEALEEAADVEAEIDTILKSALADLGLKESAEEKPEPPREKPKKARETPSFAPPEPAPEEKPAPPAAAREREAEGKRAEEQPSKVPFGGYIEEPTAKKSKAGLFIAIALLLVAAGAVYLFVLKPKKAPTSAAEVAQQTEAAPSQVQTPPESAPSGAPESAPATEPQTTEANVPAAKPQPTAPESKPAAKPQATATGTARNQAAASQGRATDTLAPIIPGQSPMLQIQNQQAPPEKPQAKPEAKQPAEKAQPVVRKAQEGDLVPLEEADAQPVAVRQVQPTYPEMALRMGIEGTVTVNALISETGDVIQTAVIGGVRGSYGFDRAAESSMKQWKFKPAMKDGVPVKVWKPFNIVFKK
jgi:TonB family protein